MATIIFNRGLNTWNDDFIHVGPLTFGPMHAHIERELRARGHHVIPITGIGAASPEVLAERSLKKLQGKIPEGEIHLLGHSTGGLVARVLAENPELKSQVRSIITVGTPHHGAHVATLGVNFAKDSPLLHRLFLTVGYDATEKTEVIRHLTPETLTDFNRRYPSRNYRREVSLLCEVPQFGATLFYEVVRARIHPGRETSDGFIWSSSQKWGEVIGPFALDHFGEIGLFAFLSPARRRRAALEFDRLCSTISDIVSE